MSQSVHCGPCNVSSHSGHRNSDVMGVLSDGEQRDEAEGAVVLMRVPSREVDVRHSWLCCEEELSQSLDSRCTRAGSLWSLVKMMLKVPMEAVEHDRG